MEVMSQANSDCRSFTRQLAQFLQNSILSKRKKGIGTVLNEEKLKRYTTKYDRLISIGFLLVKNKLTEFFSEQLANI